ncbi:FkbM family methyltransferase [Edaphobacter paludis]|uniref:FkbM family methyltransferase n=1 Tax=Edaphobacter paludis TaxID=3035702 RepID=A0AAU7CYM2_9BACT
MAHPGIPNDLKISKVAYRDRQFSIVHRRWSASDALAIKQCFEQLQYDMPTGVHGKLIERIYRDILDAGQKPLIIDCGANIGASVTWFASRYPAAHIVAIEPAPDNFALLDKNCAGLDVDLRKAGIGPQDGVAYLQTTGGEMGYRTNTDQNGIQIDMVSLDTLLASKPQSQYVPFLLKIDIEGAEKTLFCGDTSIFNQFPLIIFEPHDWMLPGQLTSQEFFRFHVAAGREFCMNHENIASITRHSSLLGMTQDLKN